MENENHFLAGHTGSSQAGKIALLARKGSQSQRRIFGSSFPLTELAIVTLFSQRTCVSLREFKSTRQDPENRVL